MSRDDFSESTKNTLRRRVSETCSNPSCQVSTGGPSTNTLKVSSIGEAAHIEGASPNSPRYNINMSSEQRRSVNNGIWLCSNCHTKIDNDPVFYNADLVHQWKAGAEQLAREKQGVAHQQKTTLINSSNRSNDSRLDITTYKKLIEIIPVNLYQIFKFGSFGDHKTMEILQPVYDFIDLCDNPTFVFEDSVFESEKSLLLKSANNAVNYIRPYLERDNYGEIRIGPTEGSLGSDLKAMHRWSLILGESTDKMFEFFNIYNNFIKKLTIALQL